MTEVQKRDIIAIELWRLPTDFFSLDSDAQWRAIAEVTVPAKEQLQPRKPCALTLGEEALAVVYFLVILGLPLLVPTLTVVLMIGRSPLLKWWLAVVVALAVHPLPEHQAWYRRNKIGVILAKYFTMTCLVDRALPECAPVATPAVEESPLRYPAVALACPHGVMNFGAVIWVYFSRWICGLDQYTAGAPVVRWVPGLRYLATSIWVFPADRSNIKRRLQEPPRLSDKDGNRYDPNVPRRGGMVGIVPDGIAGIFKSKPGTDVLFIGKKRGLMRICLEEGAMVMGGWFSGTSELFHIVTDPFGMMEWLSRRLKVSIFLFFGRWGTPVPRRVAITMCSHMVRAKKNASPTDEEVEEMHKEVYEGLSRNFDEMRNFAGYPDRRLDLQ